MFPGNRAQKNVQRIKAVPAGRGHAAAPLSVTTSLSLCLPSSAQQAEDEEIPDDGGVASFPHVFLHALNLHLKHRTVQTRSVPALSAHGLTCKVSRIRFSSSSSLISSLISLLGHIKAVSAAPLHPTEIRFTEAYLCWVFI